MFESEQDLSSIISEWLLFKSIEKKINYFLHQFFLQEMLFAVLFHDSEAGTTF